MWRPLAALVVALVLCTTCGCGGGSLGGGGGTSSTRVKLTTSTVSAAVSLPDGFSLAPSSLRAATAAGSATIDSAGAFTATVYGGGLQLCTILGPSGKPVLAGWVGSGRTTVDARSTAEVLLYFGAGAFAHRGDVARWSIDTIAGRSEVDTLAAVIVTALASDAEALGKGSDTITAAANAAVASMQASRAAKIAAQTSSRAASTRSALIDPSDTRSGITPVQESIDSVKLINAYRRRAWAYFDRVSYVPASGGEAVSSPAAVTNFQVAPVAGAAGLIGTFVDIMYGNYAYSQIETDAVSLPLTPTDAQKTTYRLTVVGPGASAGDEASLTAEQIKGRNWVIGKSLVLDFAVPLFMNCIMPHKSNEIDNYLDQVQGSAFLSDFINLLSTTCPSVWTKAESGDMAGAAWDVVNAILTSNALKLIFLDLVRSGFENIADANQFWDYAESFMNVLGLGDFILTAFDSAVQVTQAGLSNRADVWTITVNGSKVKLTPVKSSITSDDTVSLHAAVPDTTGSGDSTVLAYHWKNTGTVGGLSDGLHTSNEFDSSVADVTFTPTGSAGTDTVTVEAFVKQGGTTTSLGTATATVTVQSKSSGPVLYPRKVSILPSGTQTFEARLDTSSVDGEVTYVWTTPGTYGMLSGGATTLQTTASTMTYQAKVGVEGSDSIRVEAFVTKNGTRTSLGAATSRIAVEKRRTVIMGRWEVLLYQNNGTPWVGVFIVIPKVDGAERYNVHCYGFNDFAWYGTSLDLSKPSSFSDERDSEYWQGITGGGDTGAYPWYQARFAGMVVEVTVTYAN